MVVDFTHSTKNPIAPLAYCEISAMHTRLELLFVCLDVVEARSICEEAETTVSRLSRIFDRHDPESEVSALKGFGGPMAVGEDLYFALELCEQFRLMTEGYFDIAALGPATSRPAYKTSPDSPNEASSPAGSAPRGKIVSVGEGVVLDFGGFAKGYALEVLRKSFSERGIGSAMLNFGNSSILGIGSHPLGDSWEVRSEESGRCFRLRDSALSVSGLSEDGRRHIVDPHSPAVLPSGADVAVTGRSALICEILSTALFAAPVGKRAKILKTFEGYHIDE